MSSEHKTSGTVRACVREPSQTGNLPSFFILKKKQPVQQPFFFYLQRTLEGINHPAVPATTLSLPLQIRVKKNEHTWKLAQNLEGKLEGTHNRKTFQIWGWSLEIQTTSKKNKT